MLVEIVLVVMVVVLVFRTFIKPKGLPPGVWGLPLVGALPPRGVTLQAYFDSLKKKFGDIFTVRLGSRVVVVLTDYHLIKSSLSMPSLNHRPDFYTYGKERNYNSLGFVFSSGRVWHDSRRFTVRHLRDLGMGKSNMEGAIQMEVVGLLDHLRQHTDKPIEIGWYLNLALLNIIWGMIADRRYNINEEYMQKFAYIIKRNFKLRQGPLSMLDMMPWLIPLLPDFLKARWMLTHEFKQNNDIYLGFIEKEVEEHRATLDPDNPRDYIDAYLLEVEAQKDNPDSVFSKDPQRHLIATLSELFTASSETTSSTLRWMILYMAVYPKVQQRIQEELDAVFPRDTLPDLNHKDRLPFLEATMLEIHRRCSIAPMLLPHSASEDTSLAGYKIPKGTMVTCYAESCHYDKRYFEKPHEFYPEHFLNDQGNVITKREGFLPFGAGLRLCPGENMSNMELFLFTAAILQKFTITSPPGVTLTTDTDTDKKYPMLNMCMPYSVVFTERKTI